MAASDSVDVAGWLHERLAAASPDLLREMVKTFADALMSADADADAVCGAAYGARDEGRVNRRNGYRSREWNTRAGTVELAVPKQQRQDEEADVDRRPRHRPAGGARLPPRVDQRRLRPGMTHIDENIVCLAPAGRLDGAAAFRGFMGPFTQIVTRSNLLAAFGDEETAVVMCDTDTVPVKGAPGAECVTIRDGKIVHMRIIFDRTRSTPPAEPSQLPETELWPTTGRPPRACGGSWRPAPASSRRGWSAGCRSWWTGGCAAASPATVSWSGSAAMRSPARSRSRTSRR